MSHPLQRRIGAIRNRVRRLVTLYGVSWMIAAAVGATLVLGLADYAIRFQDLGLRVICTLLLLGALGWTCYRCLYLPSIVRLRDLDLALRLERRFPGLEDRLTSSVEFMRQAEDDPLAGSAALRRAVIAQTTAETERLDFSGVLDARPPLRAAVTTAAVCLVAAILVVLDPVDARIAVARLVNPFGSVSWPRQTRLVLRKQVSRVARGQPFELEAAAAEGTRLPAEVRIYYRFESADGTVSEEREPMRPVGDVMVARRDNVTRPFSYRVEGGDDRSMPWVPVELVAPPVIESLSIRLTPPAYTGWPPETADKHIRALAGTRIAMEAETNKPLRSAALCLEGDQKIPGLVSDDGYQFVVPGSPEGDSPEGDSPIFAARKSGQSPAQKSGQSPAQKSGQSPAQKSGQSPAQKSGQSAIVELLVDKSGSYWFELVDREGLSGGDDTRWEIRAVHDSPPTVAVEEPTANLFVTSRAVVPLRVAAKDDLAIRRIDLVVRQSDGPPEKETVLPLYQGPEHAAPQSGGGLAAGADGGDRRVLDYRWELEPLGLAPGAQVVFHATAADYRPQSSRSEPRRLVIISPDELRDRISSRQGQVVAELERVLKLQRACRAQVQSLEVRLGETGRLEQPDVDHLQAAELNQRQVSRSLTSRGEGVPMHVLALLAELENNKVDSPDVQRRMQGILAEIDTLDREHLPVIGRELIAAIKFAQVRLQEQAGPTARDAGAAGPLGTAGKSQDAVVASLERLLGQLAQWDNYRRFYREIGQLLREQEDVGRRTAELGRRTLTKELKDLTPQEAADLKILAGQQLELARRLDRTEQEMEQALEPLRQNDPLAADTVADALEEARRLAVGGQMRSCGGNLQANQIGQAAGLQKSIAQNLQDVLDILANRRQHELTRLLKKLQEAESDLAELARQQTELREQAAGASKQSDQAKRKAELERLSRDQGRLREDAERMARRLERLQADRPARTLRRAGEQMGECVEGAGKGDAESAARKAETAEKTLEEARRQLAAQRLQAQAELAMEQMSRLEDAVKHLHRQQNSVIDETQRLDGLRNSSGELGRAQAAGLADLARLERSLQGETGQLGVHLEAAGAFQLALSGAARDMGRAAAMLDRRQTAQPTQQAEKDALGRLALLLEALRPESPESQSGNTGDEPGKPGDKPPGGVQALAELKLLRLLQQEINLRTRQLQEEVAAAEKLTDQQVGEYAALREEQGRLADLVLRLLPAEPDTSEDDPAELPDVQPDPKEKPSRPVPPEEKSP